MYRAEVISKFPIIQHTYFGSMFSLEPAKNQRGVAKLIDNQRPPPRPKFDPNAPGRMPPPFLAKWKAKYQPGVVKLIGQSKADSKDNAP